MSDNPTLNAYDAGILGDILTNAHGESCDCNVCLMVQTLVDTAFATPAEPEPDHPMPCQHIDPLSGGSCGMGPNSPHHDAGSGHDYTARDRRNRDRRAEDDNDPARHPNRATPERPAGLDVERLARAVERSDHEYIEGGWWLTGPGGWSDLADSIAREYLADD